MRFISADEIASALTFPALIEAIAEAFRAEITVPLRHHHAISREGGEATLLLMPAWTGERAKNFIGAKVVTVFPGNAARGRASVTGTYLLMRGDTGEPLAAIDGRVFTLWRTAASSALAASFLARRDASRLLMVGAGALAPYLIRAHASGRPLKKISLWNRTPARAEAVAADLRKHGLDVRAVENLEAAVRAADIVSSATLSSAPLLHGSWLTPGVHLDLVGSFKPTMREADDGALKKARLYVDTRAGALKEAGDIADPLARGVIGERDIRGDLFDLCRGSVSGRESAQEITLFKSVGTAIEDLATAMLIWSRLNGA
ncbi:MAG TPA: ornithine cyclodeaminase family protein [Xanthobacteraceae bacterium]|nr:ornithine cyclodeaminase family protein [Xanthobacteraceae bacterium]